MWNIFMDGGPLMYPLLICSVISLTVIIDRTIFWVRVDIKRNLSVADEVLDLCRRGEWEGIRTLTAGSKNSVIRIMVSGILHREFSMTKAMEAAAGDEIKRMRRYMGILDTVITVAPLLGILGTVVGIILSFEALGASGIEHPQVVAAGIGQALITTATGLGIAIFTVFPYNYYNSSIENAVLLIEKYTTSLEIVYEKFTQSVSESKGRRA